MARTWLSVTVELLGGRGEELWPWPGRVLAVGPAHTFEQLADAINAAFARWDRAHLSMFTLSGGRVVTDADTGDEMAASITGPIATALDMATTKVARTVQPGAEFQFTFDLGDGWTHRCVVGAGKIDPLETLGVVPAVPLPYWGWGAIPDQYGRWWSDDDGEQGPSRRPTRPHPMLAHAWPERQQVVPLDRAELRQAFGADDADRVMNALTGHDIDDALQQVGSGVPMLLGRAGERSEAVVVSVINRLSRRAWAGDDVLAEDLLARLRGEPLAGRVVPVDLDMLTVVLEGDGGMSTGGYLDLRTGEVYDESAADPMMVGANAAIDVDDDPDRWLRVDRTGSRDGWQDMADFAARQHDAALIGRLERAIEGKGAFRHFRDLVHDEALTEAWYTFCTDRQLGRARAWLAEQGIRVG